mgnify:CR=1 FL=1
MDTAVTCYPPQIADWIAKFVIYYIKLIDFYNIPYPSSVRPKQPTSSNVSIPLRSLL